ncbi:hypothetical protein IWQ61_007594 [Dispira simplex]|nr:hypothetical protein IWQ61_007594 [Dispira simplex]
MSDQSSGLKQDDFRKLLATPRPHDSMADEAMSGPLVVPGHRKRQPVLPARMPRQGTPAVTANSPQSKSARQTTKPANRRRPADNPISSTYRDRAAERRRSEKVPLVDASDSVAVAEEAHVPYLGSRVTGDESWETTYEESKFLGGDLERSHLVKGLDYLLLEKSRRGTEGTHGLDLDATLETLRQRGLSHLTGNETSVLDERPNFLSDRGEAIYKACVETPRRYLDELPRHHSHFLPGLMVYSFELADNQGRFSDPFAVPTTVFRSKIELARLRRSSTTNDGVDTDPTTRLVLEKVAQVMVNHRKKHRKAKSPPLQPSHSAIPQPSVLPETSPMKQPGAVTPAPMDRVGLPSVSLVHAPTAQPPDQTSHGKQFPKRSVNNGNVTDDDKHTSHSDTDNSDDNDDSDDIFLGMGTNYELHTPKPTAVQIPTDLFKPEEEKIIVSAPVPYEDAEPLSTITENSKPNPTLGIVNQMISRLAKRKHALAEHDDDDAKRTK